MRAFEFRSAVPTIPESAYVAPGAVLVGDVSLGENTSVWFNAVLRADNARISIGECSNVQEGAVLHVDPGQPLSIGSNVTIGHQAMLHGCSVGDGALIGIQAVILNGAVIGKNCLVGAGSIVTERKAFADNWLILGAPAKAVRPLTDDEVAGLQASARDYVERARLYKTELIEDVEFQVAWADGASSGKRSKNT